MGGKLTNTIVVCANESEHNPRQRPLRRWLGIMPENRSSLAAYVRTRTRTTYSQSTPSRIPENCKFSGMPQPARLGRMHLHAMHRTNTTLVGSGCTDVLRGSTRFGGVADAEAAVNSPPRDARFSSFSSLHDQANAPGGIPTTSGGCSDSAISGGAPADSTSVRASGAGVLSKPMAARDTDNKRVVSLFIYLL